jgi:ABC-type nickel/cobalt efflux system permease component RcnA
MLIRARSILGTINPSSSNFSENRHKHLSNENQKISNKSLISLGLAGGIVPCPAALAIIILAVSKGTVLPGLAVVLSLSIGLGVTLVGIGILICKTSSSLLNNFDSESRIIKIMPLISGLIVTILGIIITVRALFY